MRILLLLALVLLLGLPTPADAQKVVAESDTGFDFSEVSTYSWKSRPDRANSDLADGSPLEAAIRRGADDSLQKLGLERLDSGGDLELTFHAMMADFYTSPGLWEAVDLAVAGAAAGAGGQSAREGSILIEAVRPGEDKQVWSAIGRKRIGGNILASDSPALRRKAEALAKKVARKFPR